MFLWKAQSAIGPKSRIDDLSPFPKVLVSMNFSGKKQNISITWIYWTLLLESPLPDPSHPPEATCSFRRLVSSLLHPPPSPCCLPSGVRAFQDQPDHLGETGWLHPSCSASFLPKRKSQWRNFTVMSPSSPFLTLFHMPLGTQCIFLQTIFPLLTLQINSLLSKLWLDYNAKRRLNRHIPFS